MRQVSLNEARPDFVVFPKKPDTWNPAERDRLQQDWGAQHEGFWRAMKARFVTRELGIYEFDQANFRQLQLVQIREFERDAVVGVWGIPPEILGLLQCHDADTEC